MPIRNIDSGLGVVKARFDQLNRFNLQANLHGKVRHTEYDNVHSNIVVVL